MIIPQLGYDEKMNNFIQTKLSDIGKDPATKFQVKTKQILGNITSIFNHYHLNNSN